MSGYLLLLFPILVLAGIVALVISDRFHRRQPMQGFPGMPVLRYPSAGKGHNLPTLWSRFGKIMSGHPGRTRIFTLAAALALFCPVRAVFGWGHEGHVVVALIAEHYMTPAALTRARDLLDGATLDSVASWADDYRRDHRETGPWHYVNIPLADSKIDLAQECPNGDCVIGNQSGPREPSRIGSWKGTV
jgi:hypothetical protein